MSEVADNQATLRACEPATLSHPRVDRPQSKSSVWLSWAGAGPGAPLLQSCCKHGSMHTEALPLLLHERRATSSTTIDYCKLHGHVHRRAVPFCVAADQVVRRASASERLICMGAPIIIKPTGDHESAVAGRSHHAARLGQRGRFGSHTSAILQAHPCTCSWDVCGMLILLRAKMIFTNPDDLICSGHHVCASSVARRRRDGSRAPLSEACSMPCSACHGARGEGCIVCVS